MAKSKKAPYFENMVLAGPGQQEYENTVFQTERTKHFPRYPKELAKLEDQVAIVTGAAGGQGEMEAKLIAQQGAKVVLADLNELELERVKNAIIEDGGEAMCYVMDVTNVEQWQALARTASETYGSIDILVNNAGVLQNGTLLSETRESLDHLMDVDCWGVFYGMKYCAPYMIEAGGGAIVNTASIQGCHFGPGGLFGYAMAKSAVQGMTRAASTELADYGIRVNSVHPGTILTPMTVVRGANRKPLAEACAIQRFGLSEEIASTVLFLVSDDSSYITGQGIYVDGGASTKLHLPTSDSIK